MKRPTPFTVVACLVCAAVAAFIWARDMPPGLARWGAAVIGIVQLALFTAIVIPLYRWWLRLKEQRARKRTTAP